MCLARGVHLIARDGGSASGVMTGSAGACLLADFGVLRLADAGWARASVVSLFGFHGAGIRPSRPDEIAKHQASPAGTELAYLIG
jgi:hypothetical protein